MGAVRTVWKNRCSGCSVAVEKTQKYENYTPQAKCVDLKIFLLKTLPIELHEDNIQIRPIRNKSTSPEGARMRARDGLAGTFFRQLLAET
jgi:hypothetical protein